MKSGFKRTEPVKHEIGIKGTLHSHSGQFCKHAQDTLRDLLLSSLEAGYDYIGVSEHMPRYSDEGMYPEELECGMTPSDLARQFDEYVTAARRLQRELDGRLHVLVGMETEIVSSESMEWELENIQRIRDDHELDYLVGSVHHLRGIPIDFSLDLFVQCLNLVSAKSYSKQDLTTTSQQHLLSDDLINDVNRVYQEYFQVQYALITRVEPEVLGHLDLIRKYTPTIPLLDETMEMIKRNISAVDSYGGLVEINCRRLPSGGDTHPMSDLLHLLSHSRITLCEDAHGIKDILRHMKHHSSLVERLKQNGFSHTWSLSLSKIN